MFSNCAGVTANRRVARPIRTANTPPPEIGDVLDPADDVAQHPGEVDRLQRHLDALFDRDRLGARRNRSPLSART